MREKVIENKIRDYLRTLPECWHYKAHDSTTAGIPDIIGCYKGRFFALEVKTKKGRLSKLQIYMLYKMNDAGALCGVVRSVADAKKFFKEVYVGDEVVSGTDGA